MPFLTFLYCQNVVPTEHIDISVLHYMTLFP